MFLSAYLPGQSSNLQVYDLWDLFAWPPRTSSEQSSISFMICGFCLHGRRELSLSLSLSCAYVSSPKLWKKDVYGLTGNVADHTLSNFETDEPNWGCWLLCRDSRTSVLSNFVSTQGRWQKYSSHNGYPVLYHTRRTADLRVIVLKPLLQTYFHSTST